MPEIGSVAGAQRSEVPFVDLFVGSVASPAGPAAFRSAVAKHTVPLAISKASS